MVGLILAMAGLMAFFLLVQGLLPDRTSRAMGYLESHPWRSLLLGTAAAVLLVLLAAFFGHRQESPLALLAVGAMVCMLVFPAGLGVSAELVGRRLLGGGDRRLGSALLGGAVVTISSAIPLVGWFGVLPLGALAGAGALLADAFRPKA